MTAHISTLGTQAVRCAVTDLEEAHRLAAAIRVLGREEIANVVPTWRCVVVTVSPAADADVVAAAVADVAGADLPAAPTREHVLPITYDGPDLDRVAGHAGLDPHDVVRRHLAGSYVVAFLGFAPGFAYLDGLDPALATPRLADARTRVPAGAVGIAGAVTGIYPADLPGGWNVIGHCPAALFDLTWDPPALLAPGDRVRFEPA